MGSAQRITVSSAQQLPTIRSYGSRVTGISRMTRSKAMERRIAALRFSLSASSTERSPPHIFWRRRMRRCRVSKCWRIFGVMPRRAGSVLACSMAFSTILTSVKSILFLFVQDGKALLRRKLVQCRVMAFVPRRAAVQREIGADPLVFFAAHGVVGQKLHAGDA